jgi:hypothetical protein
MKGARALIKKALAFLFPPRKKWNFFLVFPKLRLRKKRAKVFVDQDCKNLDRQKQQKKLKF